MAIPELLYPKSLHSSRRNHQQAATLKPLKNVHTDTGIALALPFQSREFFDRF
jgi:hypothetical protein